LCVMKWCALSPQAYMLLYITCLINDTAYYCHIFAKLLSDIYVRGANEQTYLEEMPLVVSTVHGGLEKFLKRPSSRTKQVEFIPREHFNVEFLRWKLVMVK
jgi:hypothetical protein